MKPGLYDLVAAVVTVFIWGMMEWFVRSPGMVQSARVALPLGWAGYPLMYLIYRRGLSGEMTDTMKAIGYNFGVKALWLIATPLIVVQFTTIHIVLYEFLLFFVLFSLSFLAIYHARESG